MCVPTGTPLLRVVAVATVPNERPLPKAVPEPEWAGSEQLAVAGELSVVTVGHAGAPWLKRTVTLLIVLAWAIGSNMVNRTTIRDRVLISFLSPLELT